MSITNHVNFSIALSASSTARAAFGTPMFVVEHSVTANRQDGPYSSVASAGEAGFTLAATPDVHGWLTAVFSQNPRTQQVLIGRRIAAEQITVSLDAIEAVDPGTWFLTNVASNTPADLMAMGFWHEARAKIFIGQSSDSDVIDGVVSTQQAAVFTFAGTPTDGTYSVEVFDDWTGAILGTVEVERSTTPATNSDLATAFAAAWDAVPAIAAISIPASPSGDDVTVLFDGLGNSYGYRDVTAPAPGTLDVVINSAHVSNVGELGSDNNFSNSAIIHHPADLEYMDGAWSGRCLGFGLDAPFGSGSWAYHKLSGIAPTKLTDAQKANLLGYNVNWNAPVSYTSGVEEPGFTFPGRVLSGRTIKVQTSIHWLRARLEEAFLNVFLKAAASNNPAVLFTDEGIQQLVAAGTRVLHQGVAAGHFVGNTESAATGRITPYIDAPLAVNVSDVDKAAGRLTGLTSEVIIAPEILSLGDPVTVGLTINLTFN